MSGTGRTHWVFRSACGCPFGVLEGGAAVNEYKAWTEFYERKSEIDKAIGRGITVQQVSHEEFSAEVYPMLLSDYSCPHVAVGSDAP